MDLTTGMRVTHKASGFSGLLIQPSGGGTFAYYHHPADMNLAVWAVMGDEGEVRFFVGHQLTTD